MAPRKSPQSTRLSKQIRALHGALIDIVSVMNRPQRDEAMIRAATKSLGRGPIDVQIASGPPGPRSAIAEPPPEPEEPRYGYGFAPRDRWRIKDEE